MPKNNLFAPEAYDPTHRHHDHTHHHHSHCGLCRIELENVSVTSGGDTLLQDVYMHIHCGQLTALVGPNGAGKTTLIRALLSQIPYTGAIHHIDDRERPLRTVRTGYVPQQLPFDKQMPVTVTDFIAASLTKRPVWTGVSKKTRARVQEALSLAQAEKLANRQMGQLSGGELQRVLLAMALTPTPDLLILDEPVSGMDQNGLYLFLDTVEQLKKSRHMAILLVSHDWSLVREYADQMVLLNKSVLCAGTPETVFACETFREAFPAAAREGK